jgi:glucose/arabinose dehydrogenase
MGLHEGRKCLSVLVLLGLASASQAGNEPHLPPPYATPSVYIVPKIIPRPNNAVLRVPPGFKIEVFADGFQVPRFMALGPAGQVLVSDSSRAGQPPPSSERPQTGMLANGGTVYVLTGPNQKQVLITNLNRPYGLAFWNDYLYVSEPESVKRYKFNAKTLSVGEGQEIVSLKGQGGFHWTRTLLFDRKGAKLYIAIGSGSNHNVGEDERRATISRCNPDGSGFEIFAAGLRNPVGLRWYPNTDTLWASVEERDELGDDLVPDYLTHVEPHGFYGWPYAYMGPHEDPWNSGVKLLEHLLRHPAGLPQASQISKLVESTITPDVLLGSHIAPLDILFYTGHQFPPEYRGGAFVALHGSVNRSKRIGYSVGFVPFQNGKPAGPLREVVGGWMLSPDSPEVWGRPVGLLQLPDGSLLISDDGARTIWKLTYNQTIK